MWGEAGGVPLVTAVTTVTDPVVHFTAGKPHQVIGPELKAAVEPEKDRRKYLDYLYLIRDFPYYATFREKGAKLACADKLGVFLSLTLCKKASFEYLAFIK